MQSCRQRRRLFHFHDMPGYLPRRHAPLEAFSSNAKKAAHTCFNEQPSHGALPVAMCTIVAASAHESALTVRPPNSCESHCSGARYAAAASPTDRDIQLSPSIAFAKRDMVRSESTQVNAPSAVGASSRFDGLMSRTTTACSWSETSARVTSQVKRQTCSQCGHCWPTVRTHCAIRSTCAIAQARIPKWISRRPDRSRSGRSGRIE